MPSLPRTLRYGGERRDNRIADKLARLRADREQGARAIRATPRWQRLARLYRQSHPICADPFGHHQRDGVIVESAQVHHRVPLHDAPELAFDEANLQALCARCHYRMEHLA